MPKDWFGRSKSIEELHHDSRNWLSEIEFINYEMKFLNNLLRSYYIDLLESGYDKHIKAVFNQFAVDSTCPLCMNAPEDRVHFLTECAKLQYIRGRYLDKLEEFLPDIRQWENEELARFIMDASKTEDEREIHCD